MFFTCLFTCYVCSLFRFYLYLELRCFCLIYFVCLPCFVCFVSWIFLMAQRWPRGRLGSEGSLVVDY
jgi:hypothetical protein